MVCRTVMDRAVVICDYSHCKHAQWCVCSGCPKSPGILGHESMHPPGCALSECLPVVKESSQMSCLWAIRRHVELEGHEFPFSRGVSFYEVNERGQIIYARDLVEPTFKPGDSALLVRIRCPMHTPRHPAC